MTLIADVVQASQAVADTTSRSRKVTIIAELLRSLEAREVGIVAGLLSGVPWQGRVGVGYSTIYGIEGAPAREPSLTVTDLDVAISEVKGATGAGSATRRKQLLADLLASATEAEADFIRRLFTGEL
jgi:DNA ligase-1